MVIQKLPTAGIIVQISSPGGHPLMVIPPENFDQYTGNCGGCGIDACTIVDGPEGSEVRTSTDYPYDHVVVNVMEDYTWAKRCQNK